MNCTRLYNLKLLAARLCWVARNVTRRTFCQDTVLRIMRATHFYKPRSVLRSTGCHRIPHNTLPNAVFLGRVNKDNKA